MGYSVAAGPATIMKKAKAISRAHCPHQEEEEPCGLAIVTIGNSLSGDGLLASLCNMLPAAASNDVCKFDVGSYKGCLSDRIAGHKAAIIVDSTQNGTAPGTVSLMDLSSMLNRATVMNFSSCHGFSLSDELRLAKHYGTLPNRLIFFGVEIDAVDWTDKVSPALQAKMPHLVNNLSLLVARVLETLKRSA